MTGPRTVIASSSGASAFAAITASATAHPSTTLAGTTTAQTGNPNTNTIWSSGNPTNTTSTPEPDPIWGTPGPIGTEPGGDVDRLEDIGIITGYRVDLGLEKLFPVTAIIRVSAPEEICTPLGDCVRKLGGVVESHN